MSVNPSIHRTGDLDRRRLLTKSLLDRCVAVLLLLLTGVWLLLIAVAVRLDTPGPVLARERRLGRDGRPFWLLSFRCSVLAVGRHGDHDDGGAAAAVRVQVPTGTGLVLRRFGLDRLPRLLNVLWGDMSLVGPAPQLPWPGEGDGAPPLPLPVRPGLLGIEEVRRLREGRWTGPVDLEDYVRHYSIGLDLAVLGRAVLGRALLERGATDGAR